MVSPYSLVLLALAAAAGSVAYAATRPAAPPPILASQAVPPLKKLSPPAATPAPGGYTIKRILPIVGPLKMGDHVWNEAGAPKTGTIIITVDLAAQVLSVFRDGYEIGTAAVLYGADAKPTPTGVYPITQKDADHHSSIYDNAPMPYMLRLTNDGVSIHASEVADGYMTHGCIGVPKAFAKRLFGVAKLGDKVIVTRGESLALGHAVKAAS